MSFAGTQSRFRDLIRKITDVVADVTRENLRDVTWVIINEVKDGHWGVGGNAPDLGDVKKLMADGQPAYFTGLRSEGVQLVKSDN